MGGGGGPIRPEQAPAGDPMPPICAVVCVNHTLYYFFFYYSYTSKSCLHELLFFAMLSYMNHTFTNHIPTNHTHMNCTNPTCDGAGHWWTSTRIARRPTRWAARMLTTSIAGFGRPRCVPLRRATPASTDCSGAGPTRARTPSSTITIATRHHHHESLLL